MIWQLDVYIDCLKNYRFVSSNKFTIETSTRVERKVGNPLLRPWVRNLTVRKHKKHIVLIDLLNFYDIRNIAFQYLLQGSLQTTFQGRTPNTFRAIKASFSGYGLRIKIWIVRIIQKLLLKWSNSTFKLLFPKSYRFNLLHQYLNSHYEKCTEVLNWIIFFIFPRNDSFCFFYENFNW